MSVAPELQKAVTRLCSVKKFNVGKVTAKLDAIFITNSTRADERRETKKAEEMAAETRRIETFGRNKGFCVVMMRLDEKY